ncbi:G-type lectin S-receptor-like serine/threonine-protein kinase At4g27290, partial [Morus notabilis]
MEFDSVAWKGNFIYFFLKITSVFTKDEAYQTSETTTDSVISIFKLNHWGSLQHLVLQNGSSEWATMYTLPTGQLCDNYGYCGINAVCIIRGSYKVCKCFEGFTSRSQEEWIALTWSKGCARKTPLDCRKEEGFVEVAGVKLPDLLEFWFNKNMGPKECKEACLKNCSCKAYANSDVRNAGSGCLMWFGDLVDIREKHVKGSDQDLYIRLSASEIKSINEADEKKKLHIVLWASLTSGTCIFGVAVWCITWKLRKRLK